MKYRIDYSPEAEKHLRVLATRQQRIVLDTVDRQLRHEAAKETRNRKPMRPNPLAPWELRIGDLRVYYDIQEKPEPVVMVLAVGVKYRNRVRIGDQEVKL